MIYPVDPTAALGAPHIRLRDGTVIPLDGAFGEDIAKLGVGERPPAVIPAGLEVRPWGSGGGGPWSPTPNDQANAARDRANRAAARDDETAPTMPSSQRDDGRGGFAAPKPGEATIGERFWDWLGTYSDPAQAFRDAMSKVRPGGTFGLDQPIGSVTVAPPASDEPYRGGALVESYTAPGTIPGASIAPLPPPRGALADDASENEIGDAWKSSEQFWAEQGIPVGGAVLSTPIAGPSPAVMDPRSYKAAPRLQGPTPAAVPPTATPVLATDPGSTPVQPGAVEALAAELGATQSKPKGKGKKGGQGQVATAGALAPVGPGAGLSAPAGYRGGQGAFAEEAQQAAGDRFIDLYDTMSSRIETTPADLSDEDRKDLLMEMGLRMMAASSRPGASLFGAAGEAGFGAMSSKRAMKAANRKQATETAKLKLDLAKNVTDLAMDAEKLELDRRKANQEYDLGLRKASTDEQQLLAQQAHWRAIEGNYAAANKIALENLNRQTRGDQIKANAEWRQTVSDLTAANESNVLLAQISGTLANEQEAAQIRAGTASADLYGKVVPRSDDEIARGAAFANPGAEGAVQWAMDEYRSLLFAQEEIARDVEMDSAIKKAKLEEVQRQMQEILRVWGPADDEERDSEE